LNNIVKQNKATERNVSESGKWPRTKFHLSWKFYIGLGVSLFVCTFFVWIPSRYTLNATIPPFEQLQKSKGTISFSDRGYRIGQRTILTKEDGEILVFSCRDYIGGKHDCLAVSRSGKKGEFWWYWLSTHPMETNRRPVQISVEGELVLNYQKTVTVLQSAKLFTLWVSSCMLVIFLGYNGYQYWKQRRRHAELKGSE
jgi:hypothetical protein